MIAFGDVIARVLDFFGITKDRVRVISGRADCGCQGRQDKINRLGFELQIRFGLFVDWIRRRMQMAAYGSRAMRIRSACWHLKMACRDIFYGN